MKKTIGTYLLESLKKYGVSDIFGVPGDYNLGLLNILEKREDINWIGSCNELNAAYAADGYGRVKGMGTLITTMGVGELSALNGIAGAYAEDVPVVQITGISNRVVTMEKGIVHHTLGDGNFNHFKNAYREVTIEQTVLNVDNAVEEIDRILKIAYINKKPVYIGVPEDIVNIEVEIEGIDACLEYPKTNEKVLKEFIDDMKVILDESKEQFIIADHLAERYKVEKEVDSLVKRAKIPVATLTMGKGIVNENLSYSIGIYNKNIPIIRESDTAILIGTKLSEGFEVEVKNKIEINPFNCKINNRTYNDIFIKDAIEAILKEENYFRSNAVLKEKPSFKECDLSGKLTHESYRNIIESILEEGDILISDEGTSFFNASQVCLPEKVKFIGQSLWSSIGYTVGATLGAAIAERNKRCILMIGDGAFQLTAQEVSTMIREDLNPIIILNNNSGYTIERYVAGATKGYNDITNWNYIDLIKAFNTNVERKVRVDRIETSKELKESLEKAKKDNEGLTFFELKMGKFEAPDSLKLYSKEEAKKDRYKEGIEKQDLPNGIL